MTTEEFQTLFKKYLEGKCTPEEEAALRAYKDQIELLDDNWDNDLGDKNEIHDRLQQRIYASRYRQPARRYLWLKIAATVLIAFSAFYVFLARQHEEPRTAAAAPKSVIQPGGNKAYLIASNGQRIELNNVRNGQLMVQAGTRVSKAKDGQVIYKYDPGKMVDEGLVYNTIGTPRGGQYQITLSDGSKVLLNAASFLKFPVAFSGKERRVMLQGEAYFEVAKNKKMPFIVDANGTSVYVLGTHFNVSAYQDDNAVTTTLLEGSVRLKKGVANTMLVPGQQGITLKAQSGFQVQQADLKIVMAWKEGYFFFRNTNIQNIMKQAARWYDVEVVYQQPELANKLFGGKISKYRDISELLKNLELTGTIHFKIEGRRIIVMQ